MKLKLISIGTKMPRWVQEGVDEYSKRIVGDLGFSLLELPMAKRTKAQSPEVCREKEGEAILASVQDADYVVSLEVLGKPLDTPALAARLEHFKSQGRNICLLVGGPDGLSKACAARADESWSLSALTLPHPLVRVIMVEQLYRASSLSKGHPYHRA
jgi:23S rRNA (pseudouridine1915-N3)-methyltransferase